MTITRCAWVCFALMSSCATVSGSRPPSALEEAQAHLERGDGEAAMAILARLQAQSPQDLSLARMIAEAHVKAGSTEAYLQELSRHDTALSHYQQGLVQFASASQASGPAIASFRKAVELAPNEGEFRYRLGLALLETEQDAAARAELERAVKQTGARPSWYVPLAKARARTLDLAGAASALRTVVVDRQANAADLKKAQAVMNEVSDPFRTFPSAARSRLEKAIQWLDVNDVPQEAIVLLEELLRDFDHEAILHALLGLAYARIDDAGRAVEELKRAIELNPDDGRNHLYLAELYASRQRSQVAEAYYRQALERNPLLSQAWLKLGDAAFDRKDLPTAREHYSVVTRLEPSSIPPRGKLALVYQLEGNWAAADQELRTILEQAPENLEFMLRLGVLHSERFLKAQSTAERSAAAQDATRWLEKVLQIQPENALASRALARVKTR